MNIKNKLLLLASVSLLPHITMAEVTIKDEVVAETADERIAIKKPLQLIQNLNRSSSITPYIINGYDTTIADFPFYARIVLTKDDKRFHICGGSIINNQYILTAAHCVEPQDLQYYKLAGYKLGVVINNGHYTDFTDSEIKPVAKATIHENYNSESLYNDIAILRLENPITESVSNINLPTADDLLYYQQLATVTAVGMGNTAYLADSATEAEIAAATPSNLLAAELTLLSDNECSALVESLYINGSFPEEKAICATPLAGSTVCNGDSGGPLTYKDSDGNNQQIGIVSYGPSGCGVRAPSVYTEIYAYKDWIQNKLNGANDSDDSNDFDLSSATIVNSNSSGSFGPFGLFGLLVISLIRRQRRR